jgi:hypothetical protein
MYLLLFLLWRRSARDAQFMRSLLTPQERNPGGARAYHIVAITLKVSTVVRTQRAKNNMAANQRPTLANLVIRDVPSSVSFVTPFGA